MLGLKRKPTLADDGQKIGIEPWLDFEKRTMHRAGVEISKKGMGVNKLLGLEVNRWAGHVSRMGLENKPEHFVKGLVAWRCRFWWEQQKLFNAADWDPLVHVYPFKPMRWEQRFPPNWMIKISQFPKTAHVDNTQEQKLFNPTSFVKMWVDQNIASCFVKVIYLCISQEISIH